MAIRGSRLNFTLSEKVTRCDSVTERFGDIDPLGSGREFDTATALADGRG